MKIQVRRVLATSTVLALSLTLAACGDDDAEGNSSSSNGEIKIASVAPLSSPAYQVPEWKAGIEAAVASINDAGGVNGQDLVLDEVCDSQFSTNGELACARKLVGARPAAIVSPFFAADQSGAIFKVLDPAKIPVVGGPGGSPAELNSPVVYPLTSSFVGPFQGMAQAAIQSGASRVVVLVDSPNPSGEFGAQFIADAVKRGGGENVEVVTGNSSSDPTFATAAAQAVDGGTESIIISGTPTNNIKFVQALRDAGYDNQIIVTGLIFPAEVIKALGEDAEGITMVGAVAFTSDTDNKGIAAFLADMEKYQPDAPVNDAALQAWSGVQLFAKAAAEGTDYTAAGITATLDKISTPVDIGTIGPWAVEGKVDTIPGFPRVVNPTVIYGTIKDGVVVADDGTFIDPFAAGSAN